MGSSFLLSFKEISVMLQKDHLIEREIDQAIWQERNRLARELHDTIVPEIYTMGLFAEALELAIKAGKHETISKNVRELRTAAGETLAGLRLILLGLRPPVLDDVGLVEALRMWLDLVADRFGIQTELNADDSWLLNEDVEEALFRISQEAVNNVLKHASAKKVRIELQYSDGKASLTVKDDGRGFDLQAVNSTSGLGLRNIQERAASIHASLMIDTAPGKGTCIQVMTAYGTVLEHRNE